MPALTRVALRIFFTAALAIGLTIALFAPLIAHHERHAPPGIAATRSSVLSPAPAAPDGTASADTDDPEVSGQTDFYGNDVTDAVARYKLDPTGSLYEQHSPQTELPHLPSPKS